MLKRMTYGRLSCNHCWNLLIPLIVGLTLGVIIDSQWNDLKNRKSSKKAGAETIPLGHVYEEEDSSDERGFDIEMRGHEEHEKNIQEDVSSVLYRSVRVLCWVLTSPTNYESKSRHLQATWGKRCNYFLFMSSSTGLEGKQGVVQLNVSEGRPQLWRKTKEAFKHVYNNFAEKADWFLKADDDTYIIAENLRFFLKDRDPNEPVYYGCHFKPYVKQGYMSGGAGYVLSKEALKRFVTIGLRNASLCSPRDLGAEDVEIGQCMDRLGVKTGDSRDSYGRGRFFPLSPEFHIAPKNATNFWFWRWTYYPAKSGIDCCSDTAISFHYMKASQMYVMDYLIYHLKPYGVNMPLPT